LSQAQVPSTTALNFYVPAKGYVESAKMIAASPYYLGREAMTFLPIHMLLGFSVELHLKAWLAHSGAGEETLRRRPFGHHLKNLYKAAKAQSLPSLSGLEEVVDCLHGPHSDFTYRYFRADLHYQSMDLVHLFDVIDALDIVVDTHIGASASRGLKPGH
jgi:hypothetical protein